MRFTTTTGTSLYKQGVVMLYGNVWPAYCYLASIMLFFHADPDPCSNFSFDADPDSDPDPT